MPERDTEQELEIFIPPVKEFCFDPDKKVFVIENKGERQGRSLKNTPDLYELSITGGDFGKKANLKDHSLGLDPFASLIEFPQLREWVAGLGQKEREQASLKIVKTMEQVYKKLNPNPLVKLPRKTRGGVFGFYANLNRDGSFELSTFGNCACLGKNVYPHISYPEIYPDLTKTSLPIEYEMHNVDYPAQALSLYAGAGTIAWLEKQSRGA